MMKLSLDAYPSTQYVIEQGPVVETHHCVADLVDELGTHSVAIGFGGGDKAAGNSFDEAEDGIMLA